MSFLQGLHGAVALALLLGLLFAEEAGVPLPFAPGEITLVVAGLLIASGGLNPFVFVPLAIVACVAGSVVAFSWAGFVGERGLQSLARRLHQQRALERVTARLQSGGWVGVGVARLIPGLRIYTTLAAGAAGLKRHTFLAGMVPTTVLWVVLFVVLGALVGIPVEHFFNDIQRLAVQGVILVLLGIGVFVTVRRTPATSGAGLVRVPRWLRILMAALIDVGATASVITGLLAVGRRLFGLGLGASWLDAAIALVVVAVFYVVVARRSAGATVGEALLKTSYASGARVPLRPAAAWRAAQRLLDGTNDELELTAQLLRTLGDPERLRLVRSVLGEPRTAAALATSMNLPEFEVQHQLERLVEAGILCVTAGDPPAAYGIRPDLLDPLVHFLAAAAPSPGSPLRESALGRVPNA